MGSQSGFLIFRIVNYLVNFKYFMPTIVLEAAACAGFEIIAKHVRGKFADTNDTGRCVGFRLILTKFFNTGRNIRSIT